MPNRISAAGGGTASRRQALAALGTVAAGLPACAYGRGGGQVAGDDLLSKTGRPETLTYSSWETGTGWEAVKKPIEAFMQEYPHIKVAADNLGGSDYDQKLQVMIAAGTGSDVYKMSSSSYVGFFLVNGLLDLTDRLAHDPVAGAKGYFVEPLETQRDTIKGQRYAMGTAWQINHLFFNRRALEGAGVPFPSNDPKQTWTWAQLLEYARKLTTDQGGRPTTDPTQVFRWGVYWGTTINTPIFSNGGQYISQSTRLFTLDQPPEYEVVQEVADLVLRYHVSPSADDLTNAGLTPAQALANGRLALLMDGNWVLQQTAQLNPPAPQWMGTGVPPMFKQPATWAGSSYQGIWSGTKKADYAWLLLRTIMEEKYQLAAVRTGQYGPLHPTSLTPEGMKGWLDPAVYPPTYELLYAEFLPKYGHLQQHVVPGFNKAWPVVNAALGDVFAGKRPARDALQDAVPRANQLLKEEEQRLGFAT